MTYIHSVLGYYTSYSSHAHSNIYTPTTPTLTPPLLHTARFLYLAHIYKSDPCINQSHVYKYGTYRYINQALIYKSRSDIIYLAHIYINQTDACLAKCVSYLYIRRRYTNIAFVSVFDQHIWHPIPHAHTCIVFAHTYTMSCIYLGCDVRSLLSHRKLHKGC